jgi:hypothetical protein
MAINKNLLIGIGVIGVGLFLSYRAKQKGQDVPFIGRLIPSPKPNTEAIPTKEG